MKKLFLTSGLVLCMTCPSFAATDIDANGQVGGSAATCVYNVLDSYTGPVSFEAKWDPNMGTITLDNGRYVAGNATAVQSASSTTNVPANLYSVYGVGVYASTTAQAGYANSTQYPRMTTIGGTPTMTGYEFAGYFTGKTDGTEVINSSGAIQYDAASTQITGVNGTATFYAHWTAKTISITYNCGALPSGASTGPIAGTPPAQVTGVAYNSSYTLEATPGTGDGACKLSGYHFKGWRCDHDLFSDGAAYSPADTNAPNYASTLTSNVWGVTTNNSGSIKSESNITCYATWAPNSIGLTWVLDGGSVTTAGGTSCTYDGGITLPVEPTKNGYHFTGWTVTNGN